MDDKYSFLKVWVFIPSWIFVKLLLKRDGLWFFEWFIDNWIGLLYEFNIMNLFDFRLHEEFILLIVHYFIYYIDRPYLKQSLTVNEVLKKVYTIKNTTQNAYLNREIHVSLRRFRYKSPILCISCIWFGGVKGQSIIFGLFLKWLMALFRIYSNSKVAIWLKCYSPNFIVPKRIPRNYYKIPQNAAENVHRMQLTPHQLRDQLILRHIRLGIPTQWVYQG